MSITNKTRKLLWGRAGARCSFSHCRAPLTKDGQNVKGFKVVIGQEAHVWGKSVSGPRANLPGRPADIDGYENLILLCPTCHTTIDQLSQDYPPAALFSVKADHEAWVDKALSVPETLAEVVLDPSSYSSICSGMTSELAWKTDGEVIVACAFGSPAEVIKGRYRGSGFSFKAISLTAGARSLAVFSEAEYDIEFWVDDEGLRILQFAWDPFQDKLIPFVQHTHQWQAKGGGKHMGLLEDPNPNSSITPAMEVLRSDLSKVDESDIWKALCILRNLSIEKYPAVQAGIDELKSAPWRDGALAEAYSAIIQEINLIQEANKSV